MILNLAKREQKYLMFNKDKILITGGAGYLGNVIVRELIKKNYEITVIDNLYFNQKNYLESCKINFLKWDVRDAKLITKNFLESFGVIIPLAALVGAPICEANQKAAYEINTKSIQHIVNNISSNTKIILPNTNSGYGIGGSKYCDESSPLNPISIYGKSKVESERIVMSHKNSISLRLATVFGMSQRMRLDLLVNHFVSEAINDNEVEIFEGKFMRNYVYILDVARAFCYCIENFDKMKNNVFNLGLEDVNLSKIDLANEIKKIIPNFKFKINEFDKDPDQRNYIVTNKKILEHGFNFVGSLNEGIKELNLGIRNLPKGEKYSNI
ncbi:NAD dependent epimerase/dehydratase family protein [alpha proteobacterium HIMB114]|nr:NAD dependent epimerase/dehydratase family protein [alpha proteobacterium HIMB114]